MTDMDMLIYQGGEVKSLGNYKIGGHCVLFTNRKDWDTAGDYFDASTDFDLDMETPEKRSGYYKHGFDLKVKNEKIGRGTITQDDIGLWLEAQIDERREYAAAILKMVEDGELGYSTGALPHLVRREAKNKAGTINHITHWPLGEWSLLPGPCEPRTLAIPLKTWVKSMEGAQVTKNLDPLKPSSVYIEKFGPVDNWKQQEWWQWLNGSQDDLEQLENANNKIENAEKSAITIATLRDLETYLHRDGGYSVKDAKTIVSRFTLRDVEVEPEPTPEEIKTTPVIDPAAIHRRQRLAHQMEGLRLAFP